MKNIFFRRMSGIIVITLIIMASVGQVGSVQADGTTYTPADVNKSFTPTTIATGGTSQLEIFIYNPNAFELILSNSPAALSDTLPGNVHFASPANATNTCGGIVSIVGDTLYLYGGTVPPAGGGTSGSCTMTASVTAVIPGTYINDIPLGVLNATDPTGLVAITNAAKSDATLTVNTVVPPSLSKSFNPNTIWVGDSSTLTVRIINNDPNTALTQVSLTDTLPSNVTVKSFSAAQCGGTVSYGAGALTISGATIAAKPGECDLTATVTSSTPGLYTNSIPASAVQTQQGVTNANAASAPLNVQAIGITKSFTPSNFQAGGTTTLNIVLQNPSSTQYTSAAFTDNLPNGITIASPANVNANNCGSSYTITANPGDGSISLSNGTIPAGSSANPGKCTISVNVTGSVPANYTNTIPAGALTASKGANEVTNVLPASANVTVYGQGLGVGGSKGFNPSSIQVDGNSELTINLTAPADTDLHNVSLTDALPATVTVSNSTPASTSGCSNSSSPTLTADTGAASISMTNGSIKAGTTCHINVYVTGSTPGTYTNTISPANISSLDASNNPRDVPGNFPANLTVSGISVSKAYYPTVINDSGVSTLTITLTNTNTAELDNVSLTDNNAWGNLTNGIQIYKNPSTGLSNVSTTCGTPINAAAGAQTISMSGGTIPAQVGSVPGVCTINVDVTGVGQKASYSNTIPKGGVSGTIHGTSIIVSNPIAATANIAVQPISIRVTKDFNPTGVFGGSSSTLSVHLLGDPNAPLAGISFTDNLPQKNATEGMTVADPPNLSTGTCGGTITVSPDGKSFSFSGGSLAANAQCTLSLSVVMNTQDNLTNTICGSVSDNIPGGSALCSKEITAGVGDVTSSNGATNTEAAQATLTNQGGLTVTKAFGPNPITAGGTSQLTITIQNLSNFALTGVGLINANGDTFPAGLTVVSPINNPQCGGGTVSWDSTNNRLTFSGGSVDALSSCSITVNVTAASIGSYKNCINKSTMTDDQDITNQTNECDTLVVNSNTPPTVAKAFTPASIPAGGTSDLSFKITNPNSASQTGIGFTDTLPSSPSQLTLSSVPNAFQCNGTVSYDSGTNEITFTGGSLAGNSNCTIDVGVTGSVAGDYANQTSAITSNEGGTGSPSNTATLTIVQPPQISKSFSPATINAGQTSTLTFTLSNPKENTVDLTGVGFTDTFPTGMTIASSPAATNSCGGSLTAAAGTGTVLLSNGTIPQGLLGFFDGTCTISVPVTASGGTYDNQSGNVSSTEGGIGNTAEDTLTVNGPGLLLTKSTTNAGFQGSGPAATITYNYVLTNTGTETLYGNDAATGYFTISDDHIGTPVDTPFTCGTATSLAPGDSVNCTQTYNVGAGDVTAGSVTNTATGTAMDAPTGGNTVTSNESSVTVYLEALTLQKSTTTSGYQASGATINYSYTITNTGKVTLYGNDATTQRFTITDDHIKAGSPPAYNNPFTCGSVTSLAPGANVTCTGSYVTTATDVTNGSVTNTAAAHGQDKTNGSTNINNVTSNQSSVTVYAVNPPTIAKAFNPAQIPVGSNSTLTFTITNPSTNVIPLTGVSFSDALPSGMTVANAPIAAQCGGTLTAAVGSAAISFANGTILANSNCTVSVVVTVAAGGTYNNTSGKVSSTNGGTNNGPYGVATDTLTATAPPTITKAFSPTAVVVNGMSTLSFKLTNGNPSPLTGVGFTDNLPAGVEVSSPPNVNADLTNCGVSDFSPAAAAGATTLTFSNGTIPANSTCTISVSVTATTSGTFDNTTTAITSAEGGTGATSNTAILTSNPAADLALTKTSRDAKGNLTPDVDPGESITYTITVTNGGPSDVSGATVSDTMPSSLTSVSWTCAATSGSCASGTNTGNISDTVNIMNGGSLTYTITATVSATDTTDVINTATVLPPSGVTETNPSNNSGTVVDHLNLLSITKTTSPPTASYAAANTTIHYSYTITNIGTSTLTNLAATDNPLGALTCSYPPALAPGDSFTCTASYTTTQADLDADKTISNTATATGADKEGDTVPATSNTVHVTASQAPSLALAKSVNSISGTSPHNAGDVITYSYTLQNTGNVTLRGADLTTQEFTIADDHIGTPPGTAFTCGSVTSLAPTATVTCTNTYTIQQADLNN
ncbi:MAG TPA: hypothetical protein VLX61_13450, partial [Anaerolineales bacterium]|nr:hypothetical protein [Anaerolineales bacterium]